MTTKTKAAALYDELSPDAKARVRAAAGKARITKERTFTAEHERRHALRILAEIAELEQGQRKRVLARAQRINEV